MYSNQQVCILFFPHHPENDPVHLFFFMTRTAKLIGDTRAVVAERGFYRPYSKIAISRSGRIDS